MNLNRATGFNWGQHLLLSSLFLLCVSVWTGCTTVALTGRSQFNMLSPGEEMQMGLSSFEQMKKDLPPSLDVYAKALVQKVGQKIANSAVADMAAAGMPDPQWEFVVFDSKEANAFCLPGGKVGVYKGILEITKDEAGLATVIGHEVAHAVARHGGERVTTAMGLEFLGSAVNAATTETKYQGYWTAGYGIGSQLLYALPHSRKQESEADRMGLIYMAQAGYDPEQAVKFWERFAAYNKQHGGETPWFLRTHPLDEDRIRQLKEWIPEARSRARAAGVK